MNNDIADYIPSLINPRTVKKDFSFTQNSVASRFSLSLRKSTGFTAVKNPKSINYNAKNKENTPTQQNNTEEHRCLNKRKISDSFDTRNETNKYTNTKCTENTQVIEHYIPDCTQSNKRKKFSDILSTRSSIINKYLSSSESLENVIVSEHNVQEEETNSLTSICTVNELYENEGSYNSDSTVHYELNVPIINVSLGVKTCNVLDISADRSALKNVVVSHNNNEILVDCKVFANSELDYNVSENVAPVASSQEKAEKVSINFKIKETKLSEDNVTENSKILFINTNAIENINHVIVQPSNYCLEKRNLFDKDKLKDRVKNKVLASNINNGSRESLNPTKQLKLDRFLKTNVLNSKTDSIVNGTNIRHGNVGRDVVDMSKKSGPADAVKVDRVTKTYRNVPNNDSPRSARIFSKKENSGAHQTFPKARNHSASSHSPKKNSESVQFSVTSRSQSNKAATFQRIVPHHKIVAGTHFAVDAFSYGDIPNVNHYFLTHFHSDHYSGLKKSFKKMLFCSKITADLCISRLNVDPKYINIIKVEDTINVEGVEVTALDANHCPGAIMLVFTLPNGKTLLHTGDFRASPMMESYAVFWNKEIHTVYLDTTYCNPRYDFPTQDQSIEMALNILRQKKLSLEKVGKKFSSVLIICGTYTIGKEKFFLGMARRVGCSIWACPEKDRVLQMVEGRSFCHAPPHSCQLHVVPMRDLTHEKLRSYLNSLQGTFSEVVAFKPSGWENGKNSTVEKDSVTIHGIPYSEHSSFSEMIRFVKFLKPKQVIPTVDISGGVRAVQKYFPCPLVYKEDVQSQSKLTDYFSIQNKQQIPVVT